MRVFGPHQRKAATAASRTGAVLCAASISEHGCPIRLRGHARVPNKNHRARHLHETPKPRFSDRLHAGPPQHTGRDRQLHCLPPVLMGCHTRIKPFARTDWTAPAQAAGRQALHAVPEHLASRLISSVEPAIRGCRNDQIRHLPASPAPLRGAQTRTIAHS